MSNTIEQHNVNAESCKALVSAVTTQLTKAGYKVVAEVAEHKGGYAGFNEKTTIRVIFGESSNKAIDGYKAKIAEAKANLAKFNIPAGEFSWVDEVVGALENPYTAYDHTGNVVMTIIGGSLYSNGTIDQISYDMFNIMPNTDTKRAWDGSSVTHQRTSKASSGSIRAYCGRPINPESTAKRLVKNIAECLSVHVSCHFYTAIKMNAAELARLRSEKAAANAEHENVKANAAFLTTLIPNSRVAHVERKYRGAGNGDDVQIKFNVSIADVSKYLANNEQYPSNAQLLEAVVAMIKATK
jgi:hypothetical protein